jgi:hypothetical protein
MTRTVMVFVAVGCLSLTAFGGRALAEDLVISGKGLNDLSAATGTTIKKSGEGVAIVALSNFGKYTVSMDGPGTMYLVGMYAYSSVQVISKTGDGDLVWVPLDPDEFCAGPTVKGKIEGDGKIRSGTQKEVNDVRSKAAEPKRASRPGAGEPVRPSLQDWLVASAHQDKPFDRLVRDYMAPAKSATWEEWFDRAAYGRAHRPNPWRK